MEYIKDKKHKTEHTTGDTPANYLFDYAYFYLETQGKIATAKNYQSIYFWFRNLFSICVIGFLTSLVIFLAVWLMKYNCSQITNALYLSFSFLIVGIITIVGKKKERKKVTGKQEREEREANKRE